MNNAIRKVLEDYASGMGKSFASVKKHYRSLPSEERFAFIRALRDLEDKHREYERDPAAFIANQKPLLYGPDGDEVA